MSLEKNIEKLEKFVREKKPVLLVGPPGVGKTTSVHLVAKKLGRKVFETNASNERRKEELEELLRFYRNSTFRPVLIFFDEVDGVKDLDLIKKIIDKSAHPVVLAANKEVKLDIEKIRFYRPRLSEVRKATNSDNVVPDFRVSKIASEFGSETYEAKNAYREVEKILKGEPFPFTPQYAGWIRQNITQNYKSFKIYKAFENLSLSTTFSIDFILPEGEGVVDPPKKEGSRIHSSNWPFWR